MPPRYSVQIEHVDDKTVYVLQDKEADLAVTISPSDGGQVTEMLFQGYSILNSPRCTPLLFPWPNRVTDATFTFNGKTITLVPTTRDGLFALHGLVRSKPWRVDDTGVSDDSVHVTISLSSSEFPDITGQFPFPFKITVTWALTDGSLTLLPTVSNVGDETMPMGFGVHTNYRVPIKEGASRDDCVVTVPAASYWEVEAHLSETGQMNPTGRKLPVDGTQFDLRSSRRLEGLRLDDVLTDLTVDEGWITCKIYDPAADITVQSLSDTNFKNVEVFAPNRNMISIQPYTCPMNAFNLAARGIDAGVIILKPGQTWTGTVKIIPKTGCLL